MTGLIAVVSVFTLAWHLAIGCWAIVTVRRLRHSLPDRRRQIEGLETLQSLVGGIERGLRTLTAIQHQKFQAAEAAEPSSPAPCTCHDDAAGDWFRQRGLDRLP